MRSKFEKKLRALPLAAPSPALNGRIAALRERARLREPEEKPRRSRKFAWAALLAGGAVACFLGGAWMGWQARGAREPVPEPQSVNRSIAAPRPAPLQRVEVWLNNSSDGNLFDFTIGQPPLVRMVESSSVPQTLHINHGDQL